MVRVSLFSAHRRPQHILVEEEQLKATVTRARDEHYGVVITNEVSDEPVEWFGGVEDRRDD